jgi:hypothetical protein
LISCVDFGGHGTERGRDGDKVGIARVGRGIDVVARGKKGIESFYEVGIPMEEHRHALYYTGSIDSESDMSIPFLGRRRGEKEIKTRWDSKDRIDSVCRLP